MLLAGCVLPPAERAARECAVIAAVVRSLHGAGEALPPLRASSDFVPLCSWGELGIAFEPAERDSGTHWVRFGRPTLSGLEARVRISIMHARLAGRSDECRLAQEGGAWRVLSCRRLWVS